MIVPAAASIAAVVVLILLLVRPPLGIAAMVLFAPFNQFVPFTPLPGVNSSTILGITAIGMTVLRFGTRLPPLRYRRLDGGWCRQ